MVATAYLFKGDPTNNTLLKAELVGFLLFRVFFFKSQMLMQRPRMFVKILQTLLTKAPLRKDNETLPTSWMRLVGQGLQRIGKERGSVILFL